jgi:hypothetical protein
MTSILRVILPAAALFVALCAAARADVVILKENGARLEGRVTVEGDAVIIETKYGAIRLDKSQVKEIIKTPTIMDEYDAKLKAADRKNADVLFELAAWCRQNDLKPQYQALLREVLAVAPDHEKARAASGQVKYNGKWMTEDEMMAAMGRVKYDGKWVTPEEKAALERAAQEQAKRDEEEKKKRDEEERKRRQQDSELTKLGEEIKTLSAERQRIEEERAKLAEERKLIADERRIIEDLRRQAPDYRWMFQNGNYYLYGQPGNQIIVIKRDSDREQKVPQPPTPKKPEADAPAAARTPGVVVLPPR